MHYLSQLKVLLGSELRGIVHVGLSSVDMSQALLCKQF